MRAPYLRAARLVVAVAAALVAFAVADSREAVSAPPPKKAAPKSVAQPASNVLLLEAIRLLECVRITLQAADHDYGGHRAAAVRDVEAAANQLREALKSPPVGYPVPKTFVTPQVVSDSMLANSIPVLRETETMLREAKHDYGGHRARAMADVKAAIAQLEEALGYSAVNNWGDPYDYYGPGERVIVSPTGKFIRVPGLVVRDRPITREHRIKALHHIKRHHRKATVHVTHRAKRIFKRSALAARKFVRHDLHNEKRYHPRVHSALGKINHFVQHHVIAHPPHAISHHAPPPRRR
jgi:hypothetical protein